MINTVPPLEVNVSVNDSMGMQLVTCSTVLPPVVDTNINITVYLSSSDGSIEFNSTAQELDDGRYQHTFLIKPMLDTTYICNMTIVPLTNAQFILGSSASSSTNATISGSLD